MPVNGLDQRPLSLPRVVKRGMVMAIDSALCAVSMILALYLRLGELPPLTAGIGFAYALSLGTALPIFAGLGLYRAIFRFAGWFAMMAVLRAVLICSLPMIAIVTMMGIPGVPRTVGIIQPIVLLLLIGLVRALARTWLGESYRGILGVRGGTSVAIFGAGSAGRQLCSALGSGSGMHVVAYVDDDPSLHGQTLNGVPIEHPDALGNLSHRRGVSDVLLAVPSASRKRRNEIIASLRQLPLRVQTLPGLADLARGRVQLSDLHDLDIDDLLGREAVAPNAILLGKNIAERTVLVTGAGGSIGSELCRQIASIGPTLLLLVDSSEFALYTIHHELMRRTPIGGKPVPAIVPLLASVRDERRMTEIIRTWRPHTVYHAAAYKHVPLVEHNIVEGIRNNVLGTLATANVARDQGVADFVLISTDKAVRPTNVMGASKRLAEMVLQAFSAEGGGTRFSMVRFGNVLGSSGSVVPLFRQQIGDGGPVTITHPAITRYFMTIREAAQLVIQAGAMASGGEVFVLDMGEPVKIYDLARNMVELSGFAVCDDTNPEGDIEISVIGLRPGEKLYEELLIGDNSEPTRHPRIMKANENYLPWIQLNGYMSQMLTALDSGDARAIRLMLKALVPEYNSESGLVDWVQLERQAR